MTARPVEDEESPETEPAYYVTPDAPAKATAFLALLARAEAAGVL